MGGGGGASGGEMNTTTSSGSDSNNNNNTTSSGIIACWPNQLFDEALGTCTYWQNVDTTNCPEYDSAKMMPELTDENANEERFYVRMLDIFY